MFDLQRDVEVVATHTGLDKTAGAIKPGRLPDFYPLFAKILEEIRDSPYSAGSVLRTRKMVLKDEFAIGP